MDVSHLRADFPVLTREIDGKPIIYMDSACQALRPKEVIETISHYYESFGSCAGRSVYKLSTDLSIKIDEARTQIARYVNARQIEEICFMRNCTEALNTVIFGLGLGKGDVVVATDREHNSVHVPLTMLRENVGVIYDTVSSKKDETFDLDRFAETMSASRDVKLVAMCHTSNVNGTTIPAREICEIAHDRGASVLLDGAQYAPYGEFDLQRTDADFYAFSAHKMCGPSGVGILTGKLELLNELRPLTFGGHAVKEATRKHVELLPSPERFEAGLQDYGGILGAGTAAEYVGRIGRREITAHLTDLNRRATELLSSMDGVSIIQPSDAPLRGGIVAFNVQGKGSHDIAMTLDYLSNIMIRSGMHCSHSWFAERGIPGAARASFYIYNTAGEVEELARTMSRIMGTD